MALRVVVLAAGEGSRFQAYGFTEPNSNLSVRQTPKTSIQSMLTVNSRGFEKVLDTALDSTILVVKPDAGIPKLTRPYNIVRVPVVQRGSASSAMLASSCIQPHDSVILIEASGYMTDYSFAHDISKILSGESEANNFQVFGSVITVPSTGDWFEPVPQMMPPPEGMTTSDWNKIDLFSAPVEPEDGTLTGDAADENAISVGIYFVSEWRRFQESYFNEISFRADSDDFDSEIQLMDVFQTMEINATERMSYVSVPTSQWRPCGTPDLYILNRGY